MAPADDDARPLPLRLLPAPLRADLRLPGLRRALDDRAHVEHRGADLQPLQSLDVDAGLTADCPRSAVRRRIGDTSPRMTARATELLRDRRVAPSNLSADFARLGAQVDAVMDAGARVIHIDVMDGHFVPPITIGPLIVAALADRVHQAGGMLDVHLMIERPERQVTEFAKAGADSITVHAEATPHLHRTLQVIKEAGCAAGAAVNPGTPIAALGEVAELLDIALCMSVDPGWGGQPFIPASLGKLAGLR